jgi:hypothetical protein
MWLQLVYRCLSSLSDGETVFRHTCEFGFEGDRVEAPGVALHLRPLLRLAQV